ncbi:hypothetical protein CDAR_285691 [Caerostris darwini]|uniref:Uncharacterized protein n=1 Tax=Caerostris darwini TaxID=1538125 RepID=A0AAV4MWE8_9ARAC|nr:hypothetical protein CDAR_285691 [Caerostris darwini]
MHFIRFSDDENRKEAIVLRLWPPKKSTHDEDRKEAIVLVLGSPKKSVRDFYLKQDYYATEARSLLPVRWI